MSEVPIKVDIEFCSKADLAARGKSVGDFLYQITKLDEENGLLEEPFEAVVDRLTPVFDATEDLWRGILINGEVKGYWNCVALDAAHQQTIEDGKLYESYINAKNLKTDLLSGQNELLFDSVCIDIPFQGKQYQLSGLIYKSIYNTLSLLPSKGIKVGNIWASIWSDHGIRFFSRWGFERVHENNPEGIEVPCDEKHWIYKVEFNEALRLLEGLIEKYGL